jgi:hypothetical protein
VEGLYRPGKLTANSLHRGGEKGERDRKREKVREKGRK